MGLRRLIEFLLTIATFSFGCISQPDNFNGPITIGTTNAPCFSGTWFRSDCPGSGEVTSDFLILDGPALTITIIDGDCVGECGGTSNYDLELQILNFNSSIVEVGTGSTLDCKGDSVQITSPFTIPYTCVGTDTLFWNSNLFIRVVE